MSEPLPGWNGASGQGTLPQTREPLLREATRRDSRATESDFAGWPAWRARPEGDGQDGGAATRPASR